jgi:hypothetical protein
MKKAGLVLLIFFVALVGSLRAEPYTGENFPTDSQIAKTLEPSYSLDKPIGKNREVGGILTRYYFTIKSQTRPIPIASCLVQRLDSGVWILEDQAKTIRIIQQ